MHVFIDEHSLHICGLLYRCISCCAVRLVSGKLAFPWVCAHHNVGWCQSLSESGCVCTCVAEQEAGRGWAVQSITVVYVL